MYFDKVGLNLASKWEITRPSYFYVLYVFFIDITYYTCYYILVRRKQYK